MDNANNYPTFNAGDKVMSNVQRAKGLEEKRRARFYISPWPLAISPVSQQIRRQFGQLRTLSLHHGNMTGN